MADKAEDLYGPTNDLQTALNNIADVIARVQPALDFWNARKVAARRQIEAYRDAIMASGVSDPAKADALDKLVGVAENVYLAGAGADTVSDAAAFASQARAMPVAVGDALDKAADDAKRKLADWASFSLAGISLMGLAAIAGVFVLYKVSK